MEVLKVPEVATYLRVSKFQVYRLIKEGKLKGFNVSKGKTRPHFRVYRKDLDAFVEKGY